jgi:hypothetical protein
LQPLLIYPLDELQGRFARQPLALHNRFNAVRERGDQAHL